MTNKALLPALLITPLLAVVLAVALHRLAPPAPTAVTAPAPVPLTPAPPAVPSTPTANPAPATPEASPRPEVEVDGAAREDASGQLLLDLALRDYLDFFLSQADQFGIEHARTALFNHASTRLGATARQQLSTVFNQYLDYKLALLELRKKPVPPLQDASSQAQITQLRQVAEQVRTLRHSHLGAALSDAFFADEEAYGEFTLARLELQANPTLSAAEREQALETLEQQLPPAIQDSRQRFTEDNQRAENTRRLLQQSQDPGELRQRLARDYPPEVVERLLAEQQQDQALRQRYRDYRQEVQRLDEAGLSEADRRAQREALRQSLFSAEEQGRVQQLELTWTGE